MNNRYLSQSELSLLRRKAVESVRIHGLSKAEARVIFGFSRTSMNKYLKEYDELGEESFNYKTRGSKPGVLNKLSPSQEEELLQSIYQKTPEDSGIQHTLWNSKVISEYVSSKFEVKFSQRGLRNMLTRLGFTSQKPIKLAYERNQASVDKWLEEEYPEIKKRASQEGARIYWADEMGLQSRDNNGKSYSLKGKKPVIKKSGKRFKCNMLAAITPQGQMNWTVFQGKFDSKKFIEFLGRLRRTAKQKVFLVLDNLNVHKSKKVKKYVEKHRDMLELFFLPSYSPDLNPQELVNQDVKANANKTNPIKNEKDLLKNLRGYLRSMQQAPQKVAQFFQKDEVKYAA